MIDQDKFIAAQAVMKMLVADLEGDKLKARFDFAMRVIEEYATVPEGEEFINTGIEIPKQFWNFPNMTVRQEWLTEWGRTQKIEGKGWYVFVKEKNLPKLKKIFDERDDSFNQMIAGKEKL